MNLIAMRRDGDVKSHASRRIRRVVSYDEGGTNGDFSPLQLRQTFPFDQQQNLLLSPAEDKDEPGVEVNIVDVAVQGEENTNEGELNRAPTAPSQGKDLSDSQDASTRHRPPRPGDAQNANLSLLPVDKTKSLGVQSRSGHKKRIHHSVAGERSLPWREAHSSTTDAFIPNATSEHTDSVSVAPEEEYLSENQVDENKDSGAKTANLSVPSLENTESSDSQSRPGHKMRIQHSISGEKVLLWREAHSSTTEASASDTNSECTENLLEKQQKRIIPGQYPDGIGSVLSASKSSGDAAEAAMKLADRILGERKKISSKSSELDLPNYAGINGNARAERSSKQSKVVAVDYAEDHILSEARNAAAQMKSSEQVLNIIGKGIAMCGGQVLGEETSSNAIDKSIPKVFISGCADASVKSDQADEFLRNKQETSQVGNDRIVSHTLRTGQTVADLSKLCSKPCSEPTSSPSSDLQFQEDRTSAANMQSTSKLDGFKCDSISLGSRSNADEEDRSQATDVSDDAYSKLAGKLSCSSHIHERKAILNTVDGFNKSPAHLKLPPLFVDSQNCPSLPNMSQSGESRNHEGLILHPRQDSPVSHGRSLTEPNSKIHDLLCDVKTNLATSQKLKSDGRMHVWVRQSSSEPVKEEVADLEDDYVMYTSGKSRTLIVHEIKRGDWTWCSAWSPNGDRLAVGTVNHHLAIIDTASSSVWKVVHDRRLSGGPLKGNTHLIRSIAWGSRYIAVGGTGDSVSIISPAGQYPVVHIINGTGFVGSLNWRAETSILAIGSRYDQCIFVDVKTTIEDRASVSGRKQKTTVSTKLLHTIKRRDWVNAVSFSSDGKNIAMGDRSGLLSVFVYLAFSRSTSPCKDFQFGAAILDISWSNDLRWLYSCGEDFAVTVIDTLSWNIVKRIQRDRWCDCVASSHSGKHVVVGGGNNGLSILGVDSGWNQLRELKYEEMVPLSASWHPQDHYLAMAGQIGTIAVIETSDFPYMRGRFICSKSGISSVDFSPDGRLMAVANKNGLVSFFDATKAELEIVYELMCCGTTNFVRWSPDGNLIAITGGDSVMLLNVISSKKKNRAIKSVSKLCLRQSMAGFEGVESVSFSPDGKMIAVNGLVTAIYGPLPKFVRLMQLQKDRILVSAWSPDGTLFAMMGRGKYLTIYDTSDSSRDWSVKFTLLSGGAGLALAWGPSVREGLQYVACGGEGKTVTILELRTREMTWEKVLVVPRPAAVTALDWHDSGVLAVGCRDGSSTIIDLGYLQSGKAVNEMDYNWQKQGCICFTEILRKENENSITALRW
eukprot:CAMPEP_0113533976 /NCGR_PEP_ID=MMETSP0015_2-20120614/4910_1 /TAXON_ID=2838 /ORGANISM="Odontella" /LENGTH=1289 /DNA_ID=CAMNT_0000433101 /DNA_START=172 /DNA_END=4038 /DNA_ORIENTATION=- /assembly_acc=CAM_ASM_000160